MHPNQSVRVNFFHNPCTIYKNWHHTRGTHKLLITAIWTELNARSCWRSRYPTAFASELHRIVFQRKFSYLFMLVRIQQKSGHVNRRFPALAIDRLRTSMQPWSWSFSKKKIRNAQFSIILPSTSRRRREYKRETDFSYRMRQVSKSEQTINVHRRHNGFTDTGHVTFDSRYILHSIPHTPRPLLTAKQTSTRNERVKTEAGFHVIANPLRCQCVDATVQTMFGTTKREEKKTISFSAETLKRLLFNSLRGAQFI